MSKLPPRLSVRKTLAKNAAKGPAKPDAPAKKTAKKFAKPEKPDRDAPTERTIRARKKAQKKRALHVKNAAKKKKAAGLPLTKAEQFALLTPAEKRAQLKRRAESDPKP